MAISIYEKKILKLAAAIIKRELSIKNNIATQNIATFDKFLFIKQFQKETSMSVPGLGKFYINIVSAQNAPPDSFERGMQFTYHKLCFRPYNWVREANFKCKDFTKQ